MSDDVRFWDIKKRPDRKTRPYRVRWAVAGREWENYFATKALAENFRGQLMKAAKRGESFSETTGLPVSMERERTAPTWYQAAREYARAKWPTAAAKSRRATADALATVTMALVSDGRGQPDLRLIRRALYSWAFNFGPLAVSPPDDVVAALAWMEERSFRITALAETQIVRVALDACAKTLTGTPAAASTVRRKRAVFHHALGYAVERRWLDANPVDRVQWRAPEVAKTVDRRVVANPAQVRDLLGAVAGQGTTGRHLVAFYGCLYFAGTRPSEGLAVRESDCFLPDDGWGRLDLVANEPRAGHGWTDGTAPRERRGLKRRGENETRPVPIPPEYVRMLREHIDTFGVGVDGRLFRTATGGAPQESTYSRTWRRAREKAFTPEQAASPLARRPYDLRHAAVSLWLNAGVPPTEVARRAGHSVDVLLRVYANCVDGQDLAINDRIAEALGPLDSSGDQEIVEDEAESDRDREQRKDRPANL